MKTFIFPLVSLHILICMYIWIYDLFLCGVVYPSMSALRLTSYLLTRVLRVYSAFAYPSAGIDFSCDPLQRLSSRQWMNIWHIRKYILKVLSVIFVKITSAFSLLTSFIKEKQPHVCYVCVFQVVQFVMESKCILLCQAPLVHKC